jgi:post-segregation antitoxin (ccd killing protein)
MESDLDKRLAPRKRAENLSIDSELAAEAMAAGLNFSAVMDEALRAHLREHRLVAWREET